MLTFFKFATPSNQHRSFLLMSIDCSLTCECVFMCMAHPCKADSWSQCWWWPQVTWTCFVSFTEVTVVLDHLPQTPAHQIGCGTRYTALDTVQAYTKGFHKVYGKWIIKNCMDFKIFGTKINEYFNSVSHRFFFDVPSYLIQNKRLCPTLVMLTLPLFCRMRIFPSFLLSLQWKPLSQRLIDGVPAQITMRE